VKPESELFDAALHLFGHFFENPPPSPASSRTWRRLERIAQRIYGRTGRLRPGDFEVLAAILHDCTKCLPLLTTLERVPLVAQAFVYLDRVATQVEACLAASRRSAVS